MEYLQISQDASGRNYITYKEELTVGSVLNLKSTQTIETYSVKEFIDNIRTWDASFKAYCELLLQNHKLINDLDFVMTNMDNHSIKNCVKIGKM